jgi:dTMP kinase
MIGKFIVFEGVEGAGKTTQIQATADWLQGLGGRAKLGSAIVTREPGGSELGQSIRHLLLVNSSVSITDRSELLLYAADRAQHLEEVIRPQIESGNIVLCDRFTDSTIAYQGYGRGINLELIDRVNQLATDGFQSDLTFWLDLDVQIGLERAARRGQKDRMERANLDFHHRVQQGYQDLATQYPDRIIRINADRDESTIQTEIRSILTQKLHLSFS